MKYICTSILMIYILCILAVPLNSAEKIEMSREFNLFTSENLKGYLTPLFTSMEESINSNIFSSADYYDCWSVGLDISVAGMFIPNSQTTYDAEKPDKFGLISVTKTAEIRSGELLTDNNEQNLQPTIYGGHSVGIFSSPQFHNGDTIYKSVGYVEGNNISFMAGLPVLQLRFGLPTRTELRFRFLTVDVADAPMTYWGLTLAQRVDQFFNLFKPEAKIGLAVHGAYSSISRDQGISADAWAFGAHISKTWNFGICVFAGLQFEGMSGKFEATREKPDSTNMNDIIYYRNSPWSEVREMKDLSIDIESLTIFKFLVGFAYKTGPVELHFDAAYASQPIVSAGISFTFGRWGNSVDINRELELKRQKQIKK